MIARPAPAHPALALGSRWRWLAGGVLTALVAVSLGRAVDWSDVAAGVRQSADEPAIMVIAAAAYAAAFCLRALAWRLLLRVPVPFQHLIANLHTSLFLNHLLPLKAGEVSRPFLAARRGVPAGDAVATSMVARTLDFVCLVLLVAIAFPATWGNGTAGRAALAGSGVVIIGVCGLALVWARPLAIGPAPVRRPMAALRRNLRAIPLARIGLATPLVLASWVLECAVLVAAARLLGVELSLGGAVGVTAFTILFQAIHVTPGGVGVYETAMTAALATQSVPGQEALAVAVLTHGMKFAYALTAGGVFAVGEGVFLLRGRRGAPARAASRFEIGMARLWNVVNEGRPFTPVFTLAVLLLLAIPHMGSADYWGRSALALLAIAPLAAVFFVFDFPLRLRAALWGFLGVFLLATGNVPFTTIAVVLAAYFGFTVVLWGTIYYHLRIGTPWTNGFRFVRLVLENPDPTSGNFLEQVPKVLLLVLLFQFGLGHSAAETVSVALVVAGGVAVIALLLQQWFFTWVPPVPQPAIPLDAARPVGPRRARRVIAIVIDGCRADRLREAHTPFLDGLRANGIDVTAMNTVYPARTVTGFSSMLTGAPPAAHRMRSNFVPSLGVKCESIFDVLRGEGMRGRLVGIAHLVDAFGEQDVIPVTAVMHNDDIDAALVDQAKATLRADDPELLVLQLLSVDQTGHARGSYNAEYLAKIEETDRTIAGFLGWCAVEGYLDGATVIVTADHGQGIGIGGHGHMSPSEARIPCIIAGEGVTEARRVDAPQSIVDVAATICAALGVRAPAACVGSDLVAETPPPNGPVTFVVPARNEQDRLPGVLAAIAASGIDDRAVIVVDDGSTDATAALARQAGAYVVAHERSLGLGAAVRTGLAAARSLAPRAVVYLDADGEYDAREAAALVTPILAGGADYVVGSRFENGRPPGMTRARHLANGAFSLLLSLCCRRWIHDGQSGFRAFSPRALAVAEIVHDYNYAQVLTLDLLRKGMTMTEVPIAYRRRPSGRSFISARYLWRVPLGMAREMMAP